MELEGVMKLYYYSRKCKKLLKILPPDFYNNSGYYGSTYKVGSIYASLLTAIVGRDILAILIYSDWAPHQKIPYPPYSSFNISSAGFHGHNRIIRQDDIGLYLQNKAGKISCSFDGETWIDL